ncbi:MAG: sigma-70 family RNA polymerase sigma factor [Gemmataceae bacterium]|nr:sigma-70 family RNA polymerase sigma factor [Gemmataceae bacterium]
MASARLGSLLEYIRSRVQPASAGASTDADLLERFLVQREEAAFETLVHRHGPMVLGVGRTVLSDPHAAEDVFQATFLVLARKAASVRKHQSLGSWLYGVAYRIALNARSSAARRRKHERQVGTVRPQDSLLPPASQELRPLLVEELNRLPQKYRAPLVLCYLEGMTNDEAAQQLQWPSGTVKGRLARAREVLRNRLARRGVTLTAAAFATVLTDNGLAVALPPALVASTLRMTVPLALGQATLTGSAPASVAALAQQALRHGLLTKVAAGLLLAIGIAGGAGLIFYPRAAAPVAGDEAPKEFAQPKLIASFAEEKHYKGHPIPLAFSPDGKRMAILTKHDTEEDELILQDVATGEKLKSFRHGDGFRSVIPDGKGLTVVHATGDPEEVRVETLDLTTFRVQNEWKHAKGRVSPAEGFRIGETVVLVGGVIEDGAAMPAPGIFGGAGFPGAFGGIGGFPFGGGAQAVVVHDTRGKKEPTLHTLPDDGTLVAAHVVGSRVFLLYKQMEGDNDLSILDLPGGKTTKLVENVEVTSLAVSADGKALALQTAENTLELWDVVNQKKSRVMKDADNTIVCFAFAPDGKTLAVASSDQKVKLWNVQTGKAEREITHGRTQQVLFSPDGALLATASPEEVKVWALRP